MSYSRIKVWIAAEILTASDLNNEHNGHITNENDLDGRLISEITTRSTLETEHDAFYAACWNAGSSEIAANRVSKSSMKDNAIGLAEIEAAATDPAAGTGGLRTLGTGALQARPGNHLHTGNVTGTTVLTIVNGAVTEAKLGTGSVAQAKLKTSQGNVSCTGGDGGHYILPGGEYGFYPQIKMSSTGSAYWEAKLVDNGTSFAGWAAYATKVWLQAALGKTIHAQQRYITSSGEIHWIFMLRDLKTGLIVSAWQAPDHPCFGNGGKPLLTPHPFGDYDESKHEIIVINPTNEEIKQMELETIVDDETKPDKDLLEVITENYEIDESSNPTWPSIPVTVGLPRHVKDKKTGKKVLADYRFMSPDTVVEPIKKIIPKSDYIKVKKLKKK